MSRPARLTSEDWIRRSLISWAQRAPASEVRRVEREARNGHQPPLPETYARKIAVLEKQLEELRADLAAERKLRRAHQARARAWANRHKNLHRKRRRQEQEEPTNDRA